MAPLKKEEIDRIAEKVVSLLKKGENTAESVMPGGKGIFPDVNSAVIAAADAQKKFVKLPLEHREKIIENIRVQMRSSADELSKMAWEETGMGRVGQ